MKRWFTWLLVSTLKKVDFPTFGKPTIPIFKEVPNRPRSSGFFSSSCFFFGGISSDHVERCLLAISFCAWVPKSTLNTGNAKNEADLQNAGKGQNYRNDKQVTLAEVRMTRMTNPVRHMRNGWLITTDLFQTIENQRRCHWMISIWIRLGYDLTSDLMLPYYWKEWCS